MKLRAKAVNSSLIFACFEVLFISSSTSAMRVAISSNSFSFMPRAVRAAEPMRIPLVINGLRLSPGTVFLFTVIPAFPSAISASFR